MLAWLLIATVVTILLAARGVVGVHWYSPTHMAGHVALGGRGLFFSRTADGIWWRLRLRVRRCELTDRRDLPPDGGGVREPRAPRGRGPIVHTAALTSRSDQRRQ